MRALILSPAAFRYDPVTGDHCHGAIEGRRCAARNKALVEDRFNAWRNGTGNPFELLADEASWTIVGRSAASKTYSSKEEFLREVIRPFNARMKEGLKPAIRNIYADGNTVIIFFDAAGTASDGKPYTNTYAWFLEMRDGRGGEGIRLLRQHRLQ